MKTTDPVKIVELFDNFGSHFTATTPDGAEYDDDYDGAIPDYWVRQKYGKTFECQDSNGSETDIMYLLNGKATFALHVADREYSNGTKTVSWEEKVLVCTVSSLDDEDKVLEIESVVDACIKPAIYERWFSRIVSNGWHLSADGAKNYLLKYGKNISAEKVNELANCARVLGYLDFADAMMKSLTPYKEFTKKEAKDNNFHSDICDFDENWMDDFKSWKIIETTASYLASIKAFPFCGEENDWKKTAKKFPDLKVRTILVEFIDDTNKGTHFETSSCEIYIQSKEEFEKVEDLCGMRGEFFNPGWTYFETE